VFLLDRFLVGLLEVLFIAISFSCCFEMAEEGLLRACLPVVGGVSPGPITKVLCPDVPALAWLF
jgi:hypothetical protein